MGIVLLKVLINKALINIYKLSMPAAKITTMLIGCALQVTFIKLFGIVRNSPHQ